MKGSRGPLTPPLARQGPQGLFKRPSDGPAPSNTTSMPMRPVGGTPAGNPSRTPRPGR